MHIILMLALVILGFAVGTKLTWLLGAPIMCAGLYCFTFGSNAWREKQENLLLLIGLVCGALILLINVFE